MSRSDSGPKSSPHPLSNAAIGIGALLVMASLMADALGFGGTAGLGWRQQVMIAAGVGLVLGGAACSAAYRRSIARAWGAAARIGPGQCLVVGTWFGLLTGIFEVLHLGFRHLVVGQHLGVPALFVWMTPLCYLAMALALAAVLAVLAAAVPRSVVLPGVVFVYAGLAVWSQALTYAWLGTGAMLVLSGAIAFQLARTASAHPVGFLRLARRTSGWMAAAVALGAIALEIESSVRESRAMASLPEPPEGAPSVLMLVLDTVRTDHLGAYGYDRDTSPTVDGIAAKGVTFDWCVSASPWTLPSHATMFTGTYAYQHRADFRRPLDDTYPTLAEILGERGYATAGFVGNVIYCCKEYGLHRGFARYEDAYVNWYTFAYSSAVTRLPGIAKALRTRRMDKGRNSADTITTSFLRWLPEAEGRPFFAFLNYFDAHSFYEPPPPYDTMFGELSPHVREWNQAVNTWSEEDIEGFINGYDGGIRYIDDQIERIVQHLDEAGRLDDTLIVIVGDHGELFGEHDLVGHCNSLYEQTLHVPLVLSMPGRVPTGVRVPDFVSNRDLPATILEVLGVAEGALPGSSLAGLWSRDADVAPTRRSARLSEVSKRLNVETEEPYSRGDMKSIVVDGLHYILNGDGEEELYDLRTDPDEVDDLMEKESGPTRVAPLRALLQEALGN